LFIYFYFVKSPSDSFQRAFLWAFAKMSICCTLHEASTKPAAMNRALKLLLLLAFAFGANAQSANPAIWCPLGARWTYNYSEMSVSGSVAVWYAGDTLVGGQSVQKLLRTVTTTAYFAPGVPIPGSTSSSILPKVLTRVVNDRVEVQANGQFYTLYDFAATPGNSWLTAPVTPGGACPSGLVLVTVDSVGRQLVAGRSLRWFRAHLTAAAGTTAAGAWVGRIYEQLGNVAQYMQPQSPICGGTDPGFMGALVGFRATGWPNIGYNGATGTLLASAEARAQATGFAVYPNPTAGAGWLNLQLPAHAAPGAQLRLLDIAGRVVRQQQVSSGQALDVRGLPAGSYAVLFSEPGQPSLARRVILE
jgi:hypothetical protein